MFILVFFFGLILSCASSSTGSVKGAEAAAATSKPHDFQLAIRMVEARIARFVITPEQMLEKARVDAKGVWDSVELINSTELADGKIEYTLRYSADQKVTDSKNTINGPKNITVSSFGPISGPNENLSAYDAQVLIDQCKEWYANDKDYRSIVDIVEHEVVTKLQYDWDSFFKKTNLSYVESLNAGLGVCDVYVQLVKEVLTKAGYKTEKWSSAARGHSWNQVIMPNGNVLYIDATWYDNCYDNHPTQYSPDNYDPWYITYDKNLFERGFKKTISMHGAWPDAKIADD